MEKKFKKGDRVRFIGDDSMYQGVSYDEFTVTEDSNDKRTDVKRYVEEELCLDNDDLELVSRPNENLKTAFLTELKELLERYNAMITVMRPTQGNPILALESEDFKVFYTTYPCIYTSITPSNIFDYDK